MFPVLFSPAIFWILIFLWWRKKKISEQTIPQFRFSVFCPVLSFFVRFLGVYFCILCSFYVCFLVRYFIPSHSLSPDFVAPRKPMRDCFFLDKLNWVFHPPESRHRCPRFPLPFICICIFAVSMSCPVNKPKGLNILIKKLELEVRVSLKRWFSVFMGGSVCFWCRVENNKSDAVSERFQSKWFIPRDKGVTACRKKYEGWSQSSPQRRLGL